MAKKKKKNWMQDAFDPANKGKLHRQLGVPEDEPIPAGKLNKAAKKGGKLGARARLAKTAKKIASKK